MSDRIVCKICNNAKSNKQFVVREMMFGIKENFNYFECNKCKCIQIIDIPDNIERYYPNMYNSFDKVSKTKDNYIKYLLKVTKSKHYLNDNKNIIGKYLLKIYGPAFLKKIKGTNVNFNSSILDVGSGTGLRLISLARDGFNNLTGIDPFIEGDIFYDNGVKIFKKELSEYSGQFDMLMLNHSFEHMPEPERALHDIYRLLKPGKIALIRIPVADSYAWKTFAVNWVALDAPRHFYLHTRYSMKILMEKAGFKLHHIMYDSDEYQFWGSEQYKLGIPMRDKRSYYHNPNTSIFTKKQIVEYKKQANILNEMAEGDAACFYLSKP